MKTRWAFVVSAVALVSILALGCTSTRGASTSPPSVTGARADVLPLAGTPPTNLSEAPDDIVITPGGDAYRANVHEQGVPDKWPEVQTVETRMDAATGAILVRYRSNVTTKAGQIRNNLLNVWSVLGLTVDFVPHTIALYTVGAPSALEFLQGSAGGLPGSLATLLVIEIPKTLASGRYQFAIGVVLDGKDYGALPCTVEVTG